MNFSSLACVTLQFVSFWKLYILSNLTVIYNVISVKLFIMLFRIEKSVEL